MENGEKKEPRKGYWPLPKDLEILHDEVIEYAVRTHKASVAKHEQVPDGPISHGALFTLHRSAIINHCSIRSLCETGWTTTSPTLIRTLLDILASAYAIVSKPEDAEYMAFKFMCLHFIQSLSDPDTPAELRKSNSDQLEKSRQQIRGENLKRVDELIANYKPQPYWFRPEFISPGEIFKNAMPRLFYMYRQFSGSVHGSFIGSLLFNDSPDVAGINPEENPNRTRSAVVASSRLLLDISWARGQFEGVAYQPEYEHIVKTLILPQKDKMVPPLPD